MEHKLGIIGFGGMAEYHYGTAKRADIGITPVAAFDVREERRKKAVELGMKAYDNIEDFLADGSFDLVLVATPNNHHCRYTCMALEAGYNVICEKPAAMNPDEVRKMIAASEKAGKFFTIHQNRRFDPDFRIVKKAIEAGYIGKPYLIESRIESENGNGCMYNWRGMLDHGGGMLPDWGVHILDQMLWFMGKAPVSVYAKVVNLYSEEVDDYSKIILTYEDGTIVQTEVTTYGPVARPRWNIYGDKGAGVMQGMGDGFIKIRRMKQDSFDSHMAPAYRDNEAYDRPQRLHHIQEFEEFNVDGEGTNSDWGSIYKNLKNVLDGKEELFVKPEQVLLCMRVIEAAFISAKENRVVYID